MRQPNIPLIELHKVGVVHNDPRPYNFILTHDSAIVLDFGFSDVIQGRMTHRFDSDLAKFDEEFSCVVE